MVDVSGGPPSTRRGGGSGGTSGKLGVPDGYTPPYDRFRTARNPKGHHYLSGRRGKLVDVRSRYDAGDEWAKIAAMAPEHLMSVQQALARIGLLTPGKFQPGATDDKTKNAFKEILQGANANGMLWGDYLDERVAMADSTGFAGTAAAQQRQALSIQLSNPDTIKAQAQTSSSRLLGSSDSVDPQHMVDEIHNQETLQQTQAYNQTGESGGSTTDPASVEALILKEHPNQAKAFALGSNGQQILSSLTQTSPEAGR